MHTVYAFFNLYQERNEINKKRPGLAHFKKIYYYYYFTDPGHGQPLHRLHG